MKRDYWKVVCPEWPNGVFCNSLGDARDVAEAERDNDVKVYIRRVRMSEEEFEAKPEI